MKRTLNRIARLTLLAVLCLVAPASQARAKPPSLTSLFPAGARAGTTTLVSATGSFDHWPVSAWVGEKGVSVQAAAEKGKLWVTVTEQAAAGPCWLRLFDEEGASALRPFFVDSLPEINEVEPNDHPKHAQALEADAVLINGRLSRSGDVDGFAMRLSRGQTLVASMEANRRLGSPMDGLLQVVNPDGFVLARNDDERDRDPQLIFEAPADGLYIIRTFAFPATPDARIGFSGAMTYVYRLTLTTRGFLDHAYPLAVSRVAPGQVCAEGWNIPAFARTIDVDDEAADVVHVAHRRLANSGEVRLMPHATTTEAEPNSLASPQAITPPISLTGRIDPDGDVDVFSFNARSGTKLAIQVESRALGFPLDPILRILDASGKVLTEVDDPGGRRNSNRDPETTFTAPSDGEFRLLVRDLNGQGGPRSVYRLTVAPVAPELRLTLSTDRYTLTPGKPLSLKVDLDRRNGFAEPVEVAAVGLPEGVSARPVTSDATGKAVTLTLEGPEARQSGPFRIIASQGKDRPTLKAAEAPVEGFSRTTADAWLTVLPSKK